MQSYVNRFHYGNEKASPELTTFWLNGDLRISAMQQIEFLYRIEKQQLGLRPESYQTLMDIFELRYDHPFRLYGKTGWGVQEGQDIGWFVGFANWGKSRYLFATIMTSPEAYYGTFDFGKGKVSIFDATRPSGARFNANDGFKLTWAFTGSNGLVYKWWSVSVVNGEVYADPANKAIIANADVQWGVK